MSKFKAGKQYKTVNGSTARIYAVDCGGNRPIQGAVYNSKKEAWLPVEWTECGKNILEGLNLAPPKLKESLYLLMGPDGYSYLTVCPSRHPDAIAVKRVTITEGEFDE